VTEGEKMGLSWQGNDPDKWIFLEPTQERSMYIQIVGLSTKRPFLILSLLFGLPTSKVTTLFYWSFLTRELPK
jgi:hypothetical protein